MNMKRYSLLREQLLEYLHGFYQAMEKNAFDALFTDNPFTPEEWLKLYTIMRNDRNALLELYLLLCPFYSTDTYLVGNVLIKEDNSHGSITCEMLGIDMHAVINLSVPNPACGFNKITWRHGDAYGTLECDKYAIDESTCTSFEKMSADPISLLRLYCMAKVGHPEMLIDIEATEEAHM